jgi:hypothetical protein
MTFGLSGAALAGVAVGGATLVSGYMQGEAAKDAASMQAGSAQAGIEEQRRQFDKIQELLAPYVAVGQPALQQQQAFLGLQGPEAERAAIERIQGGETFQALSRQGEEAILQRASATGGLRGGNVQAALAQFRPALLNQLIDQQYSRLGGMTSLANNLLQAWERLEEPLVQMLQTYCGNKVRLAGGDIAQGRAFGAIPSAIGWTWHLSWAWWCFWRFWCYTINAKSSKCII